jgi:channel protein, hemolysin III family
MVIVLGKYIESIEEWREMRRDDLGLPQYSLGEEIFSAIVHGVGTGLSIAGLAVLLSRSLHDRLSAVTLSVYGGIMILLYLISTLYHALGVFQAKKVFQILDHCTIFLMIAGTYTPISLLCFGGIAGWLLFGIVWGIAALGVVLNAVNLHRFRKFSMFCYLGLGWIIVFFFKPLVAHMDFTSILLLFGGGIVYTVGALIYWFCKRFKYVHSMYHLLMLGGSILHYFVIYRLVA